LGHLREISLDGGAWVLLEPAPGPLADALTDVVRRLAARGARTILAHPERHAGAAFESRLHALATEGCLIQWTADFLATARVEDPDALVLRLAREGLVHLIASDAHSSHAGRPVRLSHAVERLGEVCPPEQVAWIAELAPAAVLRGEEVSPPW
jgi:protein-tyrosine phosphatase